jgi:hypothetical protein
MANSNNIDILIVQYQYLEREVNYSKRQQMRVTYYALILYGAIIHTHNDWYIICGKTRVLLPILISFAILVAAILFLYSCANSQNQNNLRARNLREHICQTFNVSEDIMGAREERSVLVSWIYYSLHVIACFITVLIIVN